MSKIYTCTECGKEIDDERRLTCEGPDCTADLHEDCAKAIETPAGIEIRCSACLEDVCNTETGLQTVGDLKRALANIPDDMVLGVAYQMDGVEWLQVSSPQELVYAYGNINGTDSVAASEEIVRKDFFAAYMDEETQTLDDVPPSEFEQVVILTIGITSDRFVRVQGA